MWKTIVCFDTSIKLYCIILYLGTLELIYNDLRRKYLFSKNPSFMIDMKAALNHTKTLTCYTCKYFTESNQHILRNLPPYWHICSMVCNISNCLINCFNLYNFQSVAFQNSYMKGGGGKKNDLRCKPCFFILRIKWGFSPALQLQIIK